MTTVLRMLALPFGVPALVRDVGPDGQPMLFRELFTADSFDSLPDRVPLQRMHERGEPIGWATPRMTDAGIEAAGELLDTQRARDTLTEAQNKLMSGVSVGFVADPRRDKWAMPTRAATLPQVHRRGAELIELSLVPKGAYAEASVLSSHDKEDAQHRASERVMAPYRAEQARRAATEAEIRRERIEELSRWVETLTTERNEAPIPAPPAEAGIVIRGQTGRYVVEGAEDLHSAVYRVDNYEHERAGMLRAGYVDGIAALARRYRLRELAR